MSKHREGRVYRTSHGRWSLMNSDHFHWLTNEWWEAGSRAGLRAAATESDSARQEAQR